MTDMTAVNANCDRNTSPNFDNITYIQISKQTKNQKLSSMDVISIRKYQIEQWLTIGIKYLMWEPLWTRWKTKSALVWNIDFLIDDQQRHATWYKIHG